MEKMFVNDIAEVVAYIQAICEAMQYPMQSTST